jgi:SAM-dependent methyltransferase
MTLDRHTVDGVALRDDSDRLPGRAIKRYLASQFGNPHVLMGRVAGHVMRRRASNVRRNLWTVDLMALRPTDRVLEIGYGPGFALEQVCARLNRGRAVGLDRSRTMFDMARTRNRRTIDDGRLTLLVGSVEGADLEAEPRAAGPFDVIYAINVAMFWKDPAGVLATLRGRLARDGRVFLTVQPRLGDTTDAAAERTADRLVGEMQAAGLGDIRVERLTDLSPMAVCVIGRKTAA